MEDKEKTENTMIYLLRLALHYEKADPEFLKDVDENELYKLCNGHKVTALVSSVLNSTPDSIWNKSTAASLRRTVLFDYERKEILKHFEEDQIWYLPLKGVILKDYYPEYGLREMADNDILVDYTRMDDIRKYMIERGYSVEEYGKTNHDSYFKKPIYNFEMHRSLFLSKLDDYFSDVKRKAIKDENNNYGYHLSKEDFYIYFIAHNHKHLTVSGSGIRSLVDIYLYVNKNNDLDWKYITSQLELLGIKEEEIKLRNIAFKMFSTNNLDLTEEEKELYDFIISSGVYGNRKNYTINGLRKIKEENSKNYKLKYMYRRVFLPEEVLKYQLPFFYKHIWARPFLAAYRVGSALLFRRKTIMTELKTLKEDDSVE